ncbi:hypothetical protein D8Y28_24740 [Escherichia coli]|nr:hypothetical protein D8Y28_24740 [Escherichia coli]
MKFLSERLIDKIKYSGMRWVICRANIPLGFMQHKVTRPRYLHKNIAIISDFMVGRNLKGSRFDDYIINCHQP